MTTTSKRKGPALETVAAGYLAIVLMAAWPAKADTISLQAKSYIAMINLLDPTQWDPNAKSCQTAMAAVVDCGTLGGDSPTDGSRESGNYRLWSQTEAEATCSGNKIAAWDIRPVQHDFGKEFIWITTSGDLSKSLSAKPSPKGTGSADAVTFIYRLRGQPNQAGIDLMNRVKPRTCSYIWHEIGGTLRCQNGKPQLTATLSGSGFPSHQMWIRGKTVSSIKQGPFKNLWKCDPADPTSVQ